MDYEQAMNEIDGCRYSEHLRKALDAMNPVSVRFLEYEDGYQGEVDIDVECKESDYGDNVVVSYQYYYGSCSGCDQWESDELSGPGIVQEMTKAFTIFTSAEYEKWSVMAERGYEHDRQTWKDSQKGKE
jgi:hypothetical protein